MRPHSALIDPLPCSNPISEDSPHSLASATAGVTLQELECALKGAHLLLDHGLLPPAVHADFIATVKRLTAKRDELLQAEVAEC